MASRSLSRLQGRQENNTINYQLLRINYQIFVCILFTLFILTACATSATPEATAEPEVTATATPAPAVTATLPPTPTEQPAATATPTPFPTATPVPNPTEASLDLAGNPDLNFAQVVFVQATQNSDGRWKFDTTVRHNDEGWDHYADAWQVVDPAGNLLAERVLTHPHDTEQPFTRSQSNIDIPSDITQVIVQAKCNVHGFGGQAVLVDLTVTEGENFEVIRVE